MIIDYFYGCFLTHKMMHDITLSTPRKQVTPRVAEALRWLLPRVHPQPGEGAPSFPSQPEGKIGLPRANPRGRLRSPS